MLFASNGDAQGIESIFDIESNTPKTLTLHLPRNSGSLLSTTIPIHFFSPKVGSNVLNQFKNADTLSPTSFDNFDMISLLTPIMIIILSYLISVLALNPALCKDNIFL